VDLTYDKLEKAFLDAGKTKPSKEDILKVKESGVIE